MNLSFFLFLIGILGFILNRKNIILMIISIEIMLLAVTFLVLLSSFNFDDNIGQTFSIYIISIAGAESVIGLSILVSYYRLYFFSIIYSCLSYSFKIFFNSKRGVVYATRLRSKVISLTSIKNIIRTLQSKRQI